MAYTRLPSSMTGSDVGLPATHRSSVSIALGQLRRLVTICSLVLVVSLIVQSVVWSLATFSDVRYTTLAAAGDEVPLVVESTVADEDPALLDPLGERVVTPPPPVTADPNRVRSATDRKMALTATLAGACGRLATAALIPLVLLGVLLAAGSATDGVDRTVTAFAWATMTLFLVFPIAADFGMPWTDGGLWDYPLLVDVLDGPAVVPVEYYLQYAVVPFTTMLTVLIARSRFAAGVEAGLIRGEDLRLDPTLEREAGGIVPTSLHGSRADRIMTAFTAEETAAPLAAGGPGQGTATAAMMPGVAAPPGVAGTVGAPPDYGRTGTDAADAEHGGGPMRTTSGEAPRRLI